MELTRANYHSAEMNKAFMGSHQFADIMACAAKAMAQLNGTWTAPKNDAFLVGQYTHMASLTPDGMAEWMAKNGDSVVSAKTKKKYAAYEEADRMIERVRQSEDAVALLSGQPEHVITFDLGGVKWKAALDVADFSPDTPSFCDLKTAKDFEPWYDAATKTKVPWYESYWRQMAIYREAYRAKSNGIEPAIFIVGVTKQDPPDLALLSFDNVARLDAEIEYVKANLEHVMAIKNGDKPAEPCGKNSCPYCRANKTVKLEKAESLTWPNIA